MSGAFSKYLADDTFAIFLFHGVIPRQRHSIRNYTRKHLVIEKFTEVLRDLKSAGYPIAMDKIVDTTTDGRLPPRSFAVTFDDGFANNLSVAAPLLDEMRIPATFYVTSGFIGQRVRSWTDSLEAVLEQTRKVDIAGVAADIDGSYYTVEEKTVLMNRLRHFIKSNTEIDPIRFSDELVRKILDVDPEFDEFLDMKLSWRQVRELASNPLFTVGGHGHTHRILSFLPTSEMVAEIDQSLELLRHHMDMPVRHYSYPEGLKHCFSTEVIDALVQRGVVCCPSAEHGVNRLGDDLFHLRRVFVV